ncbi:MAG: exodeoxyribonuclease VII small subunit [Bacteroidales bacterium]|nr:exodeoxyribonuclease VII small subunit [Bacteroidales bacterium]
MENGTAMENGMEKLTYREAMEQMETLLAEMEEPDTDIETLSGKVAQVSRLMAFCRDKLLKSEAEIEKMLAKDEKNEKQA